MPLLDEPTNDLDTETLASLENAIGEFPGCVVVTAHDRCFVDRVDGLPVRQARRGLNLRWHTMDFPDAALVLPSLDHRLLLGHLRVALLLGHADRTDGRPLRNCLTTG